MKDRCLSESAGGIGMLSTSNYEARKYGVRSAMPGFIAKELCPDLIIVPHNFEKYKQARARYIPSLSLSLSCFSSSSWLSVLRSQRLNFAGE